ncbi:hypothetical membrane protein [Syntrophus aciditrophicus SB]|uniref:Hypothetical membrane protein n=2 Tax=Syntrophus TaxID=43773 RepID=Q2LRE5_SYNAS|nr:hypothetical membrane protein [Syntrophus aciditrophicus SB]
MGNALWQVKIKNLLEVMFMKKTAAMLITIFLVAGLTTAASACGPGKQGRGCHDFRRAYVRGWHDGHHGYDRWRHVHARRHVQPAPYPGAGAVVALPAVPVAGVSVFFPGISVSIH